MRTIIPTESPAGLGQAPSVLVTGRIEEIFKTLVEDAIKSQRLRPSSMAEYYLVALLSGAVNSSALLLADPAEDMTFAETYLAIKGQSGRQREETLRRLGDRALFVSGFFSDCLLRKNVHPGYYHRMGSAAYARLADEVEPSPLFELYRELARDFSLFVAILGEVSEHTAAHPDRHVLSLYEKWIWTGSRSAYDELVANGINPIRFEAGTIQ